MYLNYQLMNFKNTFNTEQKEKENIHGIQRNKLKIKKNILYHHIFTIKDRKERRKNQMKLVKSIPTFP